MTLIMLGMLTVVMSTVLVTVRSECSGDCSTIGDFATSFRTPRCCFFMFAPVTGAVHDIKKCLACSYALVPARASRGLVPQPLRGGCRSAEQARCATA